MCDFPAVWWNYQNFSLLKKKMRFLPFPFFPVFSLLASTKASAISPYKDPEEATLKNQTFFPMSIYKL